jgi:hypothetical protein
MWFVRVSVMLAVVQCASSVGGSPRFPTRIVPPFFWAAASGGPLTATVTAAARRTAVRNSFPFVMFHLVRVKLDGGSIVR